jgi:hypothetical protein
VTTWLHLLALALLSCLSPTAIVPAIILLGTRNGPRALVAYFLGGFVSVSVVVGLTASGLGTPGRIGSHSFLTGKGLFEISVGIASLVFAAMLWTRRDTHRPAKRQTGTPGWLKFVERVGWPGAFVFGLFWMNLVFAVDAGLEIAASGFGAGEETLAVFLYAALASCAPLVVLAVYLANRELADARLAAFQSWIGQHGKAALAVGLAVVGLYLTTVGAYALLA